MSKLFIQGNTDSCYKHITCGVNVYLPLYGCVSLLTHTYALCCVCDVTSEYYSKKFALCVRPQ